VRRGFKCKKDILEKLKQEYDNLVKKDYQRNFLKALKNFDDIAENNLRDGLKEYYLNERSRDQAWKTCKGSLYEYAIFRYIQDIINDGAELKTKIEVIMGDEALSSYGEQITIRNWSVIFPDVDILLVERENDRVVAILSCKTSLRERLTETAFWKRELEKMKNMRDIKLIFVTTDKDNELRTETNRYILLHVVDYTFITNPQKYEELITAYQNKYGDRKDFNTLLNKIKPIDEMRRFLEHLC